jgi:hypothetical protein
LADYLIIARCHHGFNTEELLERLVRCNLKLD